LPALGRTAFWSNAWEMLGNGLFLVILFLIPDITRVLFKVAW
jgi:hypothetical protein